ncbi:hypothetical protein A0O34_17765 [Chryseobacterium glaciei]|uniref:Integrase catalytic domain-containing protein n=1 Tax=Chryseobacterium glaciei TaxID=1685010 RepID=A0A172XZH0_9FLAO|nr:DDE-type integrase/transposase/recombinase [Chryseobacterium glaciei]ANF52252.1 hypothetical protein A0O34_17765 [Chryseobacterium glaciei]
MPIRQIRETSLLSNFQNNIKVKGYKNPVLTKLATSVSDIIYIRTGQGWLYLTTVIDLFDRKVIGWSLSETMKAQNTSIAALKMARLHRHLQDHDSLIFHSDRGIQYACTEFMSIIGKNITLSMRGIAKHIKNTLN